MKRAEVLDILMCNCAGCDKVLLGRGHDNIRRARDLSVNREIVWLRYEGRPYCRECVKARNWKEISRVA